MLVRHRPLDCPVSRQALVNRAFQRYDLAMPVIDLSLIRFAQVPKPCHKRGKIRSVKQRLLAELDTFEVTSFDRRVQRGTADAEQLKCLVDRVRYFRKTEDRRVDPINSGPPIVTRQGLVRQDVVMGFARMCHGTYCVTGPCLNERAKSALGYATASSQRAVRLCCFASIAVSRSDRALCHRVVRAPIRSP